MELRHLESFLALSSTLHFGRAAERVYLSQSALSRQIQQLERELQVTLFERSGRHVALTAAGRTLLAHAQRVVDDVRDARAALGKETGPLQGNLSISCFDGASVYLALKILSALHASHPCVTVSVATLTTRDALRAVRDGSLDAALVVLPVLQAGLHVTPLFQEELVLTLPTQHHLSCLRKVPMGLLRNEPLVTGQKGQNTRQLIDQAFGREGGEPTVVFELQSVQARKDAVRAGLGVAILGKMSVLRPIRGAGLLTRPLSPPLYRDVGLASRSGRPPDRVLDMFAEMAISTAIQLGGTPIHIGLEEARG